MLRILHVGCGNISDVWFSTITKRNDVKICGVVDINFDAAIKKVAEYNLDCPVFDNIDEALDNTKPDIAIDNIIPKGRLTLAQSCLSRGVHVLSEKPLCDSIKNAKNIIELSNKYNKNFFVMQNRRYSSNMFSYKNIIQSEHLGNIGYLNAEFFRDPHFGEFRDIMDSPLLLDMAIHTFDQARFLLGKDPISVYCHEFNPSWSWYRGNSSAICIFKFEEDIVFNYTGSWCAPGMKTSWDSNWRAIGSNGTCLWNGTDFPQAETTIKQNSNSYHPEIKKLDVKKINCEKDGHKGCIDEMVECIKNNTLASTDCRDNIKSLAMVFAAIKSANENKEIYIKEILEV